MGMTDATSAPPVPSLAVDSNAMVHAELLSIGSELLLGETVDTNAAFLGRELASLGIRLRHARMLPDDRTAIGDAFAEARARSAVVLATGGLGPTHDDLTREGLADAIGETLVEDAGLIATLEERFRAIGPMPVANRRQAQLIPSAESVPNPIGSAPGWWVERDGAVVALMPGVPAEMRRMWTDALRPRLAARFGLPPLAIRTVKAFGIGESALAERLGSLLDSPPDGVEAGIYARDDGIHVRFTTTGDAAQLDPLVAAAMDELASSPTASTRGPRDGRPGAARGAWCRDPRQLGADTEGRSWPSSRPLRLATGPQRYVGGILDAGGASGPPVGDAVLQLSLLPQDAHGRSRVRVAISGAVSMPTTELRIHGSGLQRLRRAAFGALDAVRRL